MPVQILTNYEKDVGKDTPVTMSKASSCISKDTYTECAVDDGVDVDPPQHCRWFITKGNVPLITAQMLWYSPKYFQVVESTMIKRKKIKKGVSRILRRKR